MAETQCAKILECIGFVVRHYKDRTPADPLNTIYREVPVSKFRIDFALVFAKIAIEVDGDYWHGKSKVGLNARQMVQQFKDKDKEQYLREQGWSVIRISESDLKKDRTADRLDRMMLNLLSF